MDFFILAAFGFDSGGPVWSQNPDFYPESVIFGPVPDLKNAFISKIFLDQTPVLIINVLIKQNLTCFSFTGKVSDIQGKLVKSVDNVFFIARNPCLECIRRIPQGVVAYKIPGQPVPLLYPDAPVTDCPV
jgi:hypothetical protein